MVVRVAMMSAPTEVQIRQLAAQRVAAESQLRLGLMNSVSEQKTALEQFVSAQDAVATARAWSIVSLRYATRAVRVPFSS